MIQMSWLRKYTGLHTLAKNITLLTMRGGELDRVERARRFLARCWMARGGKTSDSTGWRHNIAWNGSNITRQWSELPHHILSITDRLKSVQIECQSAVQLIERHNNPNTLVYADPPYLLSTRSKRMYKHEMNVEDHIELLEVLKAHPGPVLISAYDNDLYNQHLAGWRKETKVVQAEAGKSRTESLYINPIAVEKMGQLTFEW